MVVFVVCMYIQTHKSMIEKDRDRLCSLSARLTLNKNTDLSITDTNHRSNIADIKVK